MEIITLNCQGLRSLDHRSTLFSWLNCSHVDFLCLQETHSVSETEFSDWLQDARDGGLLGASSYNCISLPGTARSSGVAILYNDNYVMSSCISNKSGRLISATFSINSTTFQLCDIYGPNTSREGDVFFESLYPVLDAQILCILCGDFNTVVDPHVDRRGCNPFSPWAYNWSRTLSELMSVFDLQDAWRTQHPDAVSFTWHRPNGSQASRLDMFWLSSFFLPLLLSVGIFPFFHSDHSYVYLKFSLPDGVRRGRGVWKFNTSHLKDLHFVLLITQFWESWQAEKRSFSSLYSWWDARKVRLQHIIRSFSPKRASQFRKRVSSLERTLFFLQCRAERGEHVDQLVADTKADLEEAHRQQARGCRMRANI